jgi:hypothetical protein
MKDFKVEIDAKDISKLSRSDLKNLNQKKNKVSFFTDERNIKELIKKIDDISYQNVLKQKIKNLLSKYIITIISLIIIGLLLINQSQSIKEIKFVNYNTYDPEVETYLYSYLKKVGPFYYLNESLNDINFDLKTKFYDYEWISVNKNGAYLEVKIKKQGEQSYHDVDDGIVGDFVASKDAIIKMYYVKKGVVLIKELQSVSKGDLLITGNRKHLIGQVDYIKPNGVVIGEVLEYQNVQVLKKQEKTQRTGRMIVKTGITAFNSRLNFKVEYDNYEQVSKTTFNMFGAVQIKKNYYYEVHTIQITYSYDQALTYAKSIIRMNFKESSKYEVIKFIELISDGETDEYFHFRFIVKKHENIAKFVPFSSQP